MGHPSRKQSANLTGRGDGLCAGGRCGRAGARARAMASGGRRGRLQRRASSPGGGRSDGLGWTERAAIVASVVTGQGPERRPQREGSRPGGVPMVRWVRRRHRRVWWCAWSPRQERDRERRERWHIAWITPGQRGRPKKAGSMSARSTEILLNFRWLAHWADGSYVTFVGCLLG
jgi:hypothetical protein